MNKKRTVVRFRTTAWARVCTDDCDLDPGFAAVLRDVARPAQIAYQKLMGRHDGSPLGIECRSVSRNAWAFVLPDATSQGRYRVQYFDQDGFFGHHTCDSIAEAVEDMITGGYRRIDAGALDRVASTERWAVGVKRAAIMQRHQAGMIDWETAVAQMNVIKEPA